MVCSFVMFAVDVIGDYIVEAYSSIGLDIALYIERNGLLCFPHLVEEKTLIISKVLDALAAILSMRLL